MQLKVIDMTLLEQLAKQFPKTVKSRHAVTGWIPIRLFNMIEKDLRKETSGTHRVIYRGPRVSNKARKGDIPSMTMRCDATHAVIY